MQSAVSCVAIGTCRLPSLRPRITHWRRVRTTATSIIATTTHHAVYPTQAVPGPAAFLRGRLQLLRLSGRRGSLAASVGFRPRLTGVYGNNSIGVAPLVDDAGSSSPVSLSYHRGTAAADAAADGDGELRRIRRKTVRPSGEGVKQR